MENTQFSKMHAFVLFWLGVLTGAVIVGLLYHMQSVQLQTSLMNRNILKAPTSATQIQKTTTTAPQTTTSSTTTSTQAAPVPNPFAPVPNPF